MTCQLSGSNVSPALVRRAVPCRCVCIVFSSWTPRTLGECSLFFEVLSSTWKLFEWELVKPESQEVLLDAFELQTNRQLKGGGIFAKAVISKLFCFFVAKTCHSHSKTCVRNLLPCIGWSCALNLRKIIRWIWKFKFRSSFHKANAALLH